MRAPSRSRPPAAVARGRRGGLAEANRQNSRESTAAKPVDTPGEKDAPHTATWMRTCVFSRTNTRQQNFRQLQTISDNFKRFQTFSDTFTYEFARAPRRNISYWLATVRPPANFRREHRSLLAPQGVCAREQPHERAREATCTHLGMHMQRRMRRHAGARKRGHARASANMCAHPYQRTLSEPLDSTVLLI